MERGDGPERRATYPSKLLRNRKMWDPDNTDHLMKYFYWCIAAALVVTVLAVLFVPGVDDFVERTFQGYVGRAAR